MLHQKDSLQVQVENGTCITQKYDSPNAKTAKVIFIICNTDSLKQVCFINRKSEYEKLKILGKANTCIMTGSSSSISRILFTFELSLLTIP